MQSWGYFKTLMNFLYSDSMIIGKVKKYVQRNITNKECEYTFFNKNKLISNQY